LESKVNQKNARFMKAKPIIYSVLNLIGTALVYRLLITGGWLSHAYELDNPNIINLVLAIFEPIVVAGVAAYWIWRTPFFYKLLFIFFIIQLVIDAGFLALIGFFVLTYKPKMM
jgi:hypothetical protein